MLGLLKHGKPRILTLSTTPRGRLEVRLPCSWDKKPRTGNLVPHMKFTDNMNNMNNIP
jgi:hypothetical protein